MKFNYEEEKEKQFLVNDNKVLYNSIVLKIQQL